MQQEIFAVQEEIEADMPVCARPWCTSYVARHRDDFAWSALVFDDDEDHVYRFLYAEKVPVYAHSFVPDERHVICIPSRRLQHMRVTMTHG